MRIRAHGMALIGAAAALAAPVLAGCGSGDSGGSGGNAKIALLLPETKTTRYEQQDRPRFEKRVKELCPNCQVIYSNADQDAAKQQQQAEAALTNGAKVLVLDAVDVMSANAIVQHANQKNVPVISYGRLVQNADLDYFVSIDPFKVGQQQGQALMDALDKQGKKNPGVVMVNGSPTDSNAKPYKDGATSVLKQRGARILKSYDTPDWSPDKAQSEMQAAITAAGPGSIAAAYVANDGMASGVIAAMKGGNVDPKSHPVTGQDAELTGVQRVLTGDQLMTVYQPIPKIATTAADLAVPLAQGKKPDASLTPDSVDNGKEKVPSALLTTIVINSPKTIQDPIIKDGFLTAKQICVAQYAKACKAAGIQ